MRERKSFVAKNTVRLSFENSPLGTEFLEGNEYISCCAQLSYTCVFHYFNRDCNLSNDVNELSVRNVKNRSVKLLSLCSNCSPSTSEACRRPLGFTQEATDLSPLIQRLHKMWTNVIDT